MFSPKNLINWALNPQDYIWIEAILLKETPKAILIEFDGKEIWFPKAWIVRIRRSQGSRAISIKISLWHWTKKAQ